MTITQITGPKLLWTALAAMLLLVTSCGSDDDDTSDDGGNETAAVSPSGTTDSEDDSGDATDDTADTTLSGLAAFAQNYENFEGYAKYTATNFSGDSSLTSLALYHKDDNSRIDTSSASGDSIVINTPDATFLCSAGQCLEYPADYDATGAPQGAFAGLLNPESIQSAFANIPPDLDVETSSEQIAGHDATCLKYRGNVDDTNPGDEAGQLCFTDDGLMLRVVFEKGVVTGTFEATEAGTEVENSDFEPPFEVLDLSYGQ